MLLHINGIIYALLSFDINNKHVIGDVIILLLLLPLLLGWRLIIAQLNFSLFVFEFGRAREGWDEVDGPS